MSVELTARRFLIRGRVQGVGYRYFAQKAAAQWNVSGYARNLEDGSVEVFAIGTAGVLVRHALRNALLPSITLFGLALPFLLTGSVVVETVFAWPGMGKLAADAIGSRDYPVVIATALVASLLVVAGNLVADLLYAAADPRVRPT